MNDVNRFGVFLIFLAGVSFSTFGILAALLSEAGVGVAAQTSWRFLISAFVFFLSAAALSGRRALPGRSEAVVALVGGGLLMVLSFTFIGAVYVGTPVPAVAFLAETSSLFAVVLAIGFLGERANRFTAVAVAAGVVGVMLISEAWGAGLSQNTTGDILALLNALTFGTFIVFSRKFVYGKGYAPHLVNSWMFLGAAMWTLVLIALMGPSALPPLDVRQLWLIGLMVAIPTFAFYVFLNGGLKRVSASSSGIILLVTPVFTALLSYLILGEALDVVQAVGAVFIGIAIVFAVVAERATARRVKGDVV